MKNKKSLVGNAVRSAALLTGCLTAATGVLAADWNFDPRFVVSGLYDDNRHMDVDDARKVSVSGAEVELYMNISATGPRSTFSLAPRVYASFFPSEGEENGDDESLTARYNWRGQKSTAELRGEYIHRTLLKDVFPGTDIDSDLGEAGPSTGIRIIDSSNREDLLRVGPSFDFSLTQRTSLLVRADYINASYKEQAAGNYVDYDNASGLFGLIFSLSPRTSIMVSALGSTFTPKDLGSDSNSYGLQMDWNRRYSEKARYYFRAGVNNTNFDESGLGGGSGSETSVSAGAGISWAFEVTGIFLDATRRVDPNPSGYAVLQDQLRMRVQRRYSDRWSSYISAVAVRDDVLGETSLFIPRKYAAGSVGAEYRLRRSFSIEGSYTYAFQKYDTQSSNANSNAFRLTFVYQPKRSPDNSPVQVSF